MYSRPFERISGEILLNGKNSRKMSEKELAASIAYIPQNRTNVFAFSVLDMVMMGTTASFSLFSTPGKQQREIALHALRRLHMEEFADRSYAQLSGGEQQMVLIARALAQNARILLMDEPCANLDYGNQIRVMKELKKLSREGYLIIQSTHSPEHAFLFADQVLVLHNGQTNHPGAPEEILTAELLERVYQIPVQLHHLPGSRTTVCVPAATQANRPDYGHFA